MNTKHYRIVIKATTKATTIICSLLIISEGQNNSIKGGIPYALTSRVRGKMNQPEEN